MLKSIKRIGSDFAYSFSGLMLMNAVAQIIVYPIWNKVCGEEAYGNILYLISLMNIFAISMGTACNYTRMVRSTNAETQNGNYNFWLIISSFFALVVVTIISKFSKATMPALEWLLFCGLTILTMWRYYADVEFRLSLNYKGCFFYYCAIAVGYIIGVGLFLITGLWPFSLLIGEFMGLGYVFFRARILRGGWKGLNKEFCKEGKMILTLFGSYLISNVISNGDRILLNTVLGGTSVTVYYLASLLGKTLSLITTPFNSVLIGYLSRYDKKINIRMMNIVLVCSAVISAVGVIGLWACSYAFIFVIYPQNLEAVKKYILIATAAQIFYFLASVIIVVLLRFSKTKYQFYVNGIYAVSFVAFCIPSTLYFGFVGFCVSYCITSFLRFFSALLFGYWTAIGQKT